MLQTWCLDAAGTRVARAKSSSAACSQIAAWPTALAQAIRKHLQSDWHFPVIRIGPNGIRQPSVATLQPLQSRFLLAPRLPRDEGGVASHRVGRPGRQLAQDRSTRFRRQNSGKGTKEDAWFRA